LTNSFCGDLQIPAFRVNTGPQSSQRVPSDGAMLIAEPCCKSAISDPKSTILCGVLAQLVERLNGIEFSPDVPMFAQDDSLPA